MHTPVIYRWLSIALLFSAACHAPKDDDSDVIFTLDPEFTMDLFEARDDATGAATFGVWVKSMATFACGNYRIEGAATLTADVVELRLEDIAAPDTCLGAPGPARGFIPIGALPDGVYRFRVLRNIPVVNEGTLRVQQGHYELTVAREQDIVFQNRVLETLPDGYIWGYALASVEADLPRADAFLADVKPLTAEPALPPGFYSYFSIAGTGQYYFHTSIAPEGQYRTFLRRFTGNPDALRSILKSYREAPAQALDIRCWSTSGRF